MSIPAYFCNHANEVPFNCICGEDCYCKSNTCNNKNHEYGESIYQEQKIRIAEQNKALNDLKLERHDQRVDQIFNLLSPLSDSERESIIGNLEQLFCFVCGRKLCLTGMVCSCKKNED